MVDPNATISAPESEEYVLACLVLDPEVMPEVAKVIRAPTDFWRLNHQCIYRAMLAINATDPAAIVVEIERTGDLEKIGGKKAIIELLFNLARDLPGTLGVERHAGVVRDKAIRRELIRATADVRAMALDVTRTTSECVAELSSATAALADGAIVGRDTSAAEVADAAIKEFEAGGISSLTTGYEGLDRIGGGFVPGGFYVVAARPGEGKSALIGNMIERYQRREVPVGVIPLEMTNTQMMQRLCGVRANLNTRLLREGKLTGEERERAISEWRTLKTGIWFNDKPAQTVVDVAAQTRVWVRRHGIAVVFVDYLQIMGVVDADVQRHLQVGEMTKGLKRLARDLGIVVVAASQINREAESRRKADGTGGKPGLSNLKESGSIEEDADGVIGIHRPLEPKADAPTWAADVGWMKNRHGGIGHVAMAYHRASTRFTEATNGNEPELRRQQGAGFSNGANGGGRNGSVDVRGNADVAGVGRDDSEQRRKNLEAFAPRTRKDLE